MKIIVFWEIDYGNYIQYKRIMALKKSNGFFFFCFCFLFFVFCFLFLANTNKRGGLYMGILPTINSNRKIRWGRN
jgi:hypothetical protein